MYQNSYNNPFYYNGDRQFLFPFLGGALIGGAAVGLTRPRPIWFHFFMIFKMIPKNKK